MLMRHYKVDMSDVKIFETGNRDFKVSTSDSGELLFILKDKKLNLGVYLLKDCEGKESLHVDNCRFVIE